MLRQLWALSRGAHCHRSARGLLARKQFVLGRLRPLTSDSGIGSLRQVILDANASVGPDTIEFAIGTGPQTIAPGSALPAITEAVTIDGTTQPGFAGTPIIELNGTSAGSLVSGLTITAAGSTIKGLAINRFKGHGIRISGTTASGNVIAGRCGSR